MHVRYNKGNDATLKASIQARIIDNMQLMANLKPFIKTEEHSEASEISRIVSMPHKPKENNPKMLSRAERAQQLQADIGRLLNRLHSREDGTTPEQIATMQQQLLELRLTFCQVLRDRTPTELDHIRVRYVQQMQGEHNSGAGYQNTCWTCKTPVKAHTNDRCPKCTWLTCACGACLCPGFKGGPNRNIEDCENQIELLGYDIYQQLVQKRFLSRGWNNYNGRVTPPKAAE